MSLVFASRPLSPCINILLPYYTSILYYSLKMWITF